MNIRDHEGKNFWRVWPEGIRPDIVPLRPVQNMGGTAWTDYNLAPLKQAFDETIGNAVEARKTYGITVLAPTKEQIDEVATEQDEFSIIVEDLTYCYVSPETAYKEDFDIETDTFYGYHQRLFPRA